MDIHAPRGATAKRNRKHRRRLHAASQQVAPATRDVVMQTPLAGDSFGIRPLAFLADFALRTSALTSHSHPAGTTRRRPPAPAWAASAADPVRESPWQG